MILRDLFGFVKARDGVGHQQRKTSMHTVPQQQSPARNPGLQDHQGHKQRVEHEPGSRGRHYGGFAMHEVDPIFANPHQAYGNVVRRNPFTRQRWHVRPAPGILECKRSSSESHPRRPMFNSREALLFSPLTSPMGVANVRRLQAGRGARQQNAHIHT